MHGKVNKRISEYSKLIQGHTTCFDVLKQDYEASRTGFLVLIIMRADGIVIMLVCPWLSPPRPRVVSDQRSGGTEKLYQL